MGKFNELFAIGDLPGLSLEEIILKSADNLMVTNADGKICVCGWDMLKDLNMEPKELMALTVDDLVARGYYNKSTARECIDTGRDVDGIVEINGGRNKLASSSRPIFDENGELICVVTSSRNLNVINRIESELKTAKSENSRLKQIADYLGTVTTDTKDPVAESPKMQRTLEICRRVAKSDSCVLLTGESGTGKEVCANYIYKNSNHADKGFFPINCGAIPQNLIESELFGYERGAFTGANAKGHAGLFEIANGGTVFLDEIGELPLEMQTKLLRFLETGEIKRIGSNKYIRSDVRIVAATNRNLKVMVSEHKFREDLYYRINIFPVYVHPLRERPEDIVPLAEHFVAGFNKKYSKEIRLNDRNKSQLMAYNFPGNIRELRNLMERLVVTANSSVNENDAVKDPMWNSFRDAQSPLRRRGETADVSGSEETLQIDLPLKDAVREYEQAYIRKAIEACGGNITKASELLGIHRTSIYKKMPNIMEE